MFTTDEAMDEFAQWQHDTAWEAPEAVEDEVIRPGDIDDCIHEGAKVTEYSDDKGPIIAVWECDQCGRRGQLGREA